MVNKCKICGSELSKKAKNVCGVCYYKKHKITCNECKKENEVSANYFIKLSESSYICGTCKRKGDGNPNYGNNWSEEQKQAQTKLIKTKVNDEYRKKCSSGKLGKIVSSETKEKRIKTLTERFGKASGFISHTDSSKKLIGEKSKEKFTPEYKEKIRLLNEKSGNWIPLFKRNEYSLYKDLSNWKTQVITETTKGLEKLKTNGFLSKTNWNKNGVVRDHMYSRRAGFKNFVFPEIIRHPANCQLITHSENMKKSTINLDCIITLDELFDLITKYDQKYPEQNICLVLIEKYKHGERYNKENYINNFYKL